MLSFHIFMFTLKFFLRTEKCVCEYHHRRWDNLIEFRWIFSIKFWTKKFLIIIGVMMIRVFRIGKWKKSILIIRTEAGKLDRISNWPLMIDDGSTTDLMIIISGQSEDDNDGGDDCGILLLSSNMICKLEILDFWIRLTREQNKQNHYHYHQNNLQVNENKQESENMHITPKKSVWSVFSVVFLWPKTMNEWNLNNKSVKWWWW